MTKSNDKQFNTVTSIFPDKIQAIYDAWFIGDKFLKDIFGSFQQDINASQMNKRERDVVQPYLDEYYNVRGNIESSIPQRYATGRIINNVIEALNQKQPQRHRLPRFLVIMPDKDLINDLENLNVDEEGDNKEVFKEIAYLVNYLTRQIDIIVRRKRLQISEKKPGAICADDPIVIYVTMLNRVDRFHPESRMGKICYLRSKFNDLLNEAAARQEQHIMNIKCCQNFEHFQRSGELSAKGKAAFWAEVDDLLERFDRGKVKLIPKINRNQKQQCRWNNYDHSQSPSRATHSPRFN